MKSILVLGSSGQIGEYLSSFLKKQGYHVKDFDIEISDLHDMRIKSKYLEDCIKESDFIFFLAFDVGGSRYLNKYQDTYDFISNNIKIMNNTFELLNMYKKPFIFASSQMSNMSYSNYGILKAIGESYTKSISGIVVKFWNVYGYETNPEKYHVITDFILKAKNTGVIDMISDGEEERDLLYVDDCCEAMEIIMKNYKNFSSEDNLHVASFNSIKIKDVAGIVAEYYNAKVIPSTSQDNIQKNKKNIPSTTILDYWKPKTDIYSGIHKIIERVSND